MVEVSEYVDVRKRAEDLRCNAPDGLTLLPRNFDTATSREALVHEQSAATVRVLLRQEGITETRLDSPSERFPEVHEKSLVFLGPIIFCSAALLSQNPTIVSLALGVISNYLTEFFRGLPGDHTVRLDIVTEEGEGDNHRYKRYHFEGPTDSLPEFTKMIQEAQRHD